LHQAVLDVDYDYLAEGDDMLFFCNSLPLRQTVIDVYNSLGFTLDVKDSMDVDG